MKTLKFTDGQIAFALRQAETGTKVAEVCRKMSISDATFYIWKKKYGGLGISELRRLKVNTTDCLHRPIGFFTLDHSRVRRSCLR